MKYRKKPVMIDAYQTDKEMDIETLEGVMHANVGDYIITGVDGEQYPCKPGIFAQTYEAYYAGGGGSISCNTCAHAPEDISKYPCHECNLRTNFCGYDRRAVYDSSTEGDHYEAD
ncbi:MAG: hypothetical protein PHI98_14840 [Eubacteriales bacterium]|nr:hypothetical protein [Eubacteriales bacterium]